MSKWDGTYASTHEANRSLGEDILEAGVGNFCYPTSTGGTVRQTDSRIDVYGQSDSSRGHSHDGYDANTNSVYHHD